MIQETQIQSLVAQLRTQTQIPIGGVAPQSYGMQIIPGTDESLLLWTEGNNGGPQDYPAVMWNPVTPRPILPNTGNLKMSYTMTLGGNLLGANVFETDTLIVVNGMKFNLSGQYRQSSGFMVVNAAGGWVDTGITFGPLLTDIPYAVEWEYQFASESSVIAISVNNDRLLVPATLQNIAAQASNWTPGAYPQIQLGSVPSAQAWSMKIDDLMYEWS